MSGRYDITIEQGATWSRTVRYETDAGAAIDLTGYTARMQVRTDYAATSTLASITSASGISITAATGTLTLTLTAAQTEAMPAGRHVYDLELVTGATVVRLLEGRATVTPEVTR